MRPPGILLAALLSASTSVGFAAAGVVDLPFTVEDAKQAARDSWSGSGVKRIAHGFEYRITSNSHGAWRYSSTRFRDFAHWEYSARVDGAVTLGVHLAELRLPAGATLTVASNRGEEQVIRKDVSREATYFTTPLSGDELTFTLTVPGDVANEVYLEIERWNVGFREVEFSPQTKSGDGAMQKSVSRPNVNYACIGPASTETASRATVGIITNGEAACSATLINHPDSDERPFVLTAAHCSDRLERQGQEIAPRTAAFFEQVTPCEEGRQNGLGSVGSVNTADRRDGVAMIYRDPEQDFGGDVMVFELEGYPSDAVATYLAGYDGTGTNEPEVNDMGVAVHHAEQLHQQYWNKAFIQRSEAELATNGSNSRRSEYYFYNNDGNIAPGSSGAGLYHEDLRVIGVTSGATEDVAIFTPLDAAMDNGLAADLGGVRQIAGAEAPSAPPPEVDVTSTPQVVEYGQTFTVSWTSSADATSCEAFGAWSGGLGTSGSEELGPFFNETSRTQIETFGVRCQTDQGTPGGGSVDVEFLPDPPAVSLTTSSETIGVGETASLQWDSNRALSCAAAGDWAGSKGTSGMQDVGPFDSAGSRTFTLECSNDGGTSTESVTVDVQEAEDVDLSFTGPNSAQTGETFDLSWNAANADSCAASGDWGGSFPAQGTETVSAGDSEGTLQFNLSCSGAGASDSGTVTVTVSEPAPEPVTVSLSGPSSIETGEAATLSWSSSNANRCIASGDWSGNVAANGSAQVGPFSSPGQRQFRLLCENDRASASDEITMDVVANTPPPVVSMSAPNEAEVGEQFTITYSASNADSCDADGDWSGENLRPSNSEPLVFQSPGSRTFSLVCSGAGGQGSAERMVTIVPAPAPVSVSTEVDREEVMAGELITIDWSSENGRFCEAADDLADALPDELPTEGFAEVRLNTPGEADLTIVCTGGDGDTDRATSRVTVLADEAPNPADPPTDGGGDSGGSGGGSFGFGFLLLGAAALFRRRAA